MKQELQVAAAATQIATRSCIPCANKNQNKTKNKMILTWWSDPALLWLNPKSQAHKLIQKVPTNVPIK